MNNDINRNLSRASRNKNVEVNVQSEADRPDPHSLPMFQIVYCIDEQTRWIVDTKYEYKPYKV